MDRSTPPDLADLTPELLCLQHLAARPWPFWRRHWLPRTYVALLVATPFWEPPPPRPSLSAHLRAILAAGLLALAPPVPMPTPADLQAWCYFVVYDARSGNGLAEARLYDRSGQLLGTTGADGSLNVLASPRDTDVVVVERPGYRRATYRRHHDQGPYEQIAMLSVPAPHPAPRPTPSPSPHPWASPRASAPVSQAASPPTRSAPPSAKPTLRQAPPPRPPAKPASPKHSALPPGGKGEMGKPYKVRVGDSLWRIAKRELGSAGSWGEIFRYNQPRLTSSSMLRPGMTLWLPLPHELARSWSALRPSLRMGRAEIAGPQRAPMGLSVGAAARL